MAERLLKTKRQKIAPAKPTEEEPKKVVLVGTYAGSQLTDWPGFYPYPISSDDKVDAESCAKVNEIWLFKGTKEPKYFAAEFVGIKTREELKALGYPAKGKGHGDGTYLLFKIEKTYAPASSSAALAASVESVIVRTKDFARSPKVRKQLKAYLESTDRTDKELAAQLPSIITKLPAESLRVCEAAVQLDFISLLDTSIQHIMSQKVACRCQDAKWGNRFTCLDFFAGSGLVSLGLSREFVTVWANDISEKKALVFNANNEKGILDVKSIEKINGEMLPRVDLSWGSFPCQDLSLAGDIKGLYASRSGLFWQWLRVMDEMSVKPPVVVAENVVGLVAAENGKYYLAVHNELRKRGYRVGALMLDAERWVPQSRKRIFVIGVRSDIELAEYVSNGPTWCHPAPVCNVARQVDDWLWWRLPEPVKRETSLEDIIDFSAPCDSEEENAAKLKLVAEEKLIKMKDAGNLRRRVFTGYRRTRNHKQVLEVRMDDVAGCLRTPGGGSSRQIVLIAHQNKVSTRLLTVRETARLMGAPDSYQIPGSYNDGYMAMGDAVAVPVASYLSKMLLAPLARLARNLEG